VIAPPAHASLPPAGFHPAQSIQHAEFTSPPALRRHRYTGRRLQGIKYERKVHEYLERLYGGLYVPSPWLRFFSEGKWRWCQPDALLFMPSEGRIIIVECKYQHTSDAWWQVRHLYGPVLQHIFPPALWSFEVCEVVKWFDPAVCIPERVVLANEVDMPHSAFKVHIWKP
jgi:hypothetical protein